MKQLNVSALAILLVSIVVLPGAAAADPVIAEVDNLGDTLVFRPVVQFNQLILTVTGPCDFQFRQVFSKQDPFFRLDATTIDGAYTYNLVRTEAVDPTVVRILKKARANFDEETPRQLCRDGKLPAAPIAQSEGFLVQKGQIIYDPKSQEEGSGKALASDADFSPEDGSYAKAAEVDLGAFPLKDFVINDDLIVDGSACIGFDCVNGEVFSFDTIRLKENNLRIKFDDTSVVPSFPANDWQLTANESANGGASKFSIEDVSGSRTPFTVEANARSHSLYVDDGGRIGSRTSTPSVEIHTIDGDTPTLRLQQDGSSGFEPQTWDVAGNETNFFIRDVTNGSTLPFRIRPGAPSNAIFVDVSGDVGFGTSSPDADTGIHVSQTGTTIPSFESSNGGAVQFRLKTDSATNRRIVGLDNSDNVGSQLNLGAAGAIRFLGEDNSSGVCLQFRDSDDAGDTACTFLNGAINCVVGTC